MLRASLLLVLLLVWQATAAAASYRTANFIVTADSTELAREVGDAAEAFRHDLAVDWLGSPLPQWASPCPITVKCAPGLGAGGATSFMFGSGQVYDWRMTVQGSRERILDSVVPHEVMHTIFATHFRQALPRWADEGACTTVEHASEQRKHERQLIEYLKTGRGISFTEMFRMTEYPADVMPLYSQGYSLARYLIAHCSRGHFIDFLRSGLDNGDWTAAVRECYGYSSLAELQADWLAWVRAGSPEPHEVRYGLFNRWFAQPQRWQPRPCPNGQCRIRVMPVQPQTIRPAQPPVYQQPPSSSITPVPAPGGLPVQRHPSVVRIRNAKGQATDLCSGVVIAKGPSYVLTCWHEFRDGLGSITVQIADGSELPATFVGADKEHDLGLLLVEGHAGEPVPMRLDLPSVGELVTGHGYGSGDYRTTAGAVLHHTGTSEAPNTGFFWKAESRSGDSGGPVFDAHGRLVGIEFGSRNGESAATATPVISQFLRRLMPQGKLPDPNAPPVPDDYAGPTPGVSPAEDPIDEVPDRTADLADSLVPVEKPPAEAAPEEPADSLPAGDVGTLSPFDIWALLGGGIMSALTSQATAWLVAIGLPGGIAGTAAWFGVRGGLRLGRRLWKKRQERRQQKSSGPEVPPSGGFPGVSRPEVPRGACRRESDDRRSQGPAAGLAAGRNPGRARGHAAGHQYAADASQPARRLRQGLGGSLRADGRQCASRSDQARAVRRSGRAAPQRQAASAGECRAARRRHRALGDGSILREGFEQQHPRREHLPKGAARLPLSRGHRAVAAW